MAFGSLTAFGAAVLGDDCLAVCRLGPGLLSLPRGLSRFVAGFLPFHLVVDAVKDVLERRSGLRCGC